MDEFDVTIRQNLAVHGDERRVENSSRSHDDLVGRVAVESPGQLCGLDADAGRKLNKANSGIRERLLKSIEHRTRQSETPTLDEFGDLPA